MSYMTYVDGKLKTVYDIEEALTHLKDAIRQLEKENKSLRERNKFLEEEYSKDEEVQKYKKMLEQAKKEAANVFSIPENINKKINNWQKKHVKEKHWDIIHDMPMSSGAIGGRFSYEFIPTGIGTLITCTCSCGEKISEMDG